MDENNEYLMRTRKRRRDYKSLEDGKDDPNKVYSARSKPTGSKESKQNKLHIISIDTNHLKPSDKGSAKVSMSHTSHQSDGGRTNGRWTSEEHK